MEIMPSEYQQLELSRFEKIFIRHALSSEQYGFLLLKVNPAMRENDYMHVLISADGVLMFKFFGDFENSTIFQSTMEVYSQFIHEPTIKIISEKLLGNKALVDDNGELKIAVNIAYVFPKLNYEEIIQNDIDDKIKEFAKNHCLFCEEFSKLRTDFYNIINAKLQNTIVPVSQNKLVIQDNNVNSIIQRIAPEYVTVRVSTVLDEKTSMGADNDLLVVTEDDLAVKAFRLDKDQINIINKINKGDQLILACAGSGKSVLLISKCFKAAEMNPDKQFLITCYNENLRSLYSWFIDRAGLRAKNVTCLTFHKLCKHLLAQNSFTTFSGDFDGWITSAIQKLNERKIKERYYGIFIDEVQEFDTEWYKFCFNLLENKETDDHLFVICGDKTQKLKDKQKHGKAPWNAGEGYPNYRGGNKNIRIEKNYRNCIEINEYINRFVSNAKKYLYSIQDDYELDPDMFLRGQSVSHGYGVEIKHLQEHCNKAEAQEIVMSIEKIHNENKIPYDEIAVIMYNASYNQKFDDWKDWKYNIETSLMSLMGQKDIPFCQMYSTESEWASNYGSKGGVKLLKFASVLGLDFRAAIVCGLKPLGFYNKTKRPNWNEIKKDQELFETTVENTHSDIRNLYVACTRAKEVLHIILSEEKEDSVYVGLMENSL